IFFQAEDGIRDRNVTGVQTCALPISLTTNVFYSFHISLFENSVFSEQKNLYLPICYCNRKPSDSSSSDSRTNRLKPVIFAAPVIVVLTASYLPTLSRFFSLQRNVPSVIL